MAPAHHWLEGWNDLQIDPNACDMVQPAIQPLYNTRHTAESLMAWAGQPVDGTPYCAKPTVRPTRQRPCTRTKIGTQVYTTASLAVAAPEESEAPVIHWSGFRGALRTVAARKGGTFELDVYRKVAIGDGQQAGNPMLQETPDPITKTTWDNYVTMARADMEAMGLNTYIAQEDPASVVKVTAGGQVP